MVSFTRFAYNGRVQGHIFKIKSASQLNQESFWTQGSMIQNRQAKKKPLSFKMNTDELLKMPKHMVNKPPDTLNLSWKAAEIIQE